MNVGGEKYLTPENVAAICKYQQDFPVQITELIACFKARIRREKQASYG